MAYNRFARKRYTAKVKTPYGKVVDEKKKLPKKPKVKKPAVLIIPKYKMAFCLMTIPAGIKAPSDSDQLLFIKASIKDKNIFTKITFAELPVIPRTLVFRIEKYIDSGRLEAVRIAKSILFENDTTPARYVYVVVKTSVTWGLKS